MSAIWPLLARLCSIGSHHSIAKESNGRTWRPVPGNVRRCDRGPNDAPPQLNNSAVQGSFLRGSLCTHPSTSPENESDLISHTWHVWCCPLASLEAYRDPGDSFAFATRPRRTRGRGGRKKGPRPPGHYLRCLVGGGVTRTIRYTSNDSVASCITTSTRCCSSAAPANPALAAAEIIRPIEIFVAGRATAEWFGSVIPVAELAEDACLSWICTHLREDVSRHVHITPLVRPGSGDLQALFARGAESGTGQ